MNWQCKWKDCIPQIPKELTPVISQEPTPKKMKGAPETNTIDENDGQHTTETNKSANQPDLYNLCWHSKQCNKKDFDKKLDSTPTVKFSGSTIVHVLIPEEVVKLKRKGLVFIHLN